ncbi:MAG: hypothetical protein GYB67_18310 [Chloroflexi bacterium]|nr:hypothetical protein [Chloroflexota bacterium]
MANQEVRARALGAVLTNALVRWESLVTIAVTLILFLFVPEPFPWWQAWFWLVAGLIAEAALIIATVTDPRAAQAALAREFESRYDLRQIRSEDSRRRLESALEYRRNMMTLIGRHQGAMRSNLQQTLNDINDWIAHMYDLALHIDAFEGNALVKRDQREVPRQLEAARQRLDRERQANADPDFIRDLEAQVDLLDRQITNLQATENGIRRAQVQLDSTLSSVGTIYAQMSLLGTKEVDSSNAQRLRLEIRDEVAELQDTIDALDEVQSQRLRIS